MHEDNLYKITPQEPISSGFGPETTALEALGGRDLSGKIAIVTGGYSGIGLETTRALAEAGTTVIVPARTPEKARASIGDIPRVEIEELDLIDQASIDAFAQRFLASGRPLDILINNAGIFGPPQVRDERGYEIQFATNHLGHFQLTARLWPALKQADNGRVVSLSSIGIRLSGIDFDDPNFERREYDKWKAYGQAKSANALFAIALDRRGYSHGVRAFTVHPGAVLSGLTRYMSEEEISGGNSDDAEGTSSSAPLYVFKTAEQGAATSVWCAASTQLDGKGGVYCEDVDISKVVSPDSPMGPGVVQWAIDPELAEKLWKLSEEMTGVKFTI